MSLSRRTVLRSGALVAGATALGPGALAMRPPGQGGGSPCVQDAPTTGFEDNGGSAWTTHEEELAFLEAVVACPANPVTLRRIGTTAQGRPLHLVVLGLGATPRGTKRTMPTSLVIGSQHGNEPAGREAALRFLRDLAYADLSDPANARLRRLLSEQTVLVIPSANPDGREANSRTNSDDVDINRDHLTLETREARAISGVVRRWEPSISLDLHEYGPSVPVLYDDDLLYLWPRNLNVDPAVQDTARSYCEQYLKRDTEAAGWTADEYGLAKLGPNVGPLAVDGLSLEVAQTAGGPDEGICRNASGLRHTMGILVESATTPQGFRPTEADTATLLQRRVDSQVDVLASMVRFMVEQGDVAKQLTDGSRVRKAREGRERSAPLFFDGADNEAPTSLLDPPPSGYRLSEEQAADPVLRRALRGHGVRVQGRVVPMGQEAEPVVGLLLDGEGSRSLADAERLS